MSATKLERSNSRDVCRGQVVIPVEFSPRGWTSLPLAQTAAHAFHVIRRLIHVQATALSREDDVSDESSLFILSTKGNISASDPLPGATPEQLLRRWSGPLITMGPRYRPSTPAFSRIVLCMDPAKPPPSQLIDDVAAWASLLALPVVVFGVAPSGAGSGGEATDDALMKQVTPKLTGGAGGVDVVLTTAVSVPDAIVQFADAKPGSLIALATHARHVGSGMLLGGTATSICQRSRSVVLLSWSDPPDAAAGTR